jgi:hypothetical protein
MGEPCAALTSGPAEADVEDVVVLPAEPELRFIESEVLTVSGGAPCDMRRAIVRDVKISGADDGGDLSARVGLACAVCRCESQMSFSLAQAAETSRKKPSPWRRIESAR